MAVLHGILRDLGVAVLLLGFASGGESRECKPAGQ
jgi:hypothetical protein